MTGSQTDVLRRLLDVALAVAGERRVEPVLRTVLEAARDIAGARYAAVAVPDPSDGIALFLTSGIDAATWDAIGYLPMHHGLLGVLLKDPSPIRLDDIRSDPRFTGWPEAHPEMRAFLGVPILAGGEILAELYLTDKIDGRPFTQADQQFIETLAAHAALAIVNAQRLERARELTVAEERSRLARDLHDSVTQTLFSLSLSAETAATIAGADDQPLADELDRIRVLGRAALGELRTLVDTLHQPEIKPEGLAAALRRRVELLRRVHDVPVELTISAQQFPNSVIVDRELTRIAHEALANALQHARASRIRVTVTGGDTVVLVVDDDGCGFDLDRVRGSSRRLGLSSMRERATALGGTLLVQTAPGRGTRIVAEVPSG